MTQKIKNQMPKRTSSQKEKYRCEEDKTSSPATVARRRLNYQNRVSCEQDADDSVSELKGSSVFTSQSRSENG